MPPIDRDGRPWLPFAEPEPTSLRPPVALWRHGIDLLPEDAALDLRYPEPHEGIPPAEG